MLSLKHFILQQRVLRLYRAAVRASRSAIPDPRARTETLRWVRAEIERNKHLTDIAAIENQLSIASRELHCLFPGHSARR